MQDTAKGYVDMEKRVKNLLPEVNVDFSRMGGLYYTSPSQVENPGTIWSDIGYHAEENKWSCFYVLDDIPEVKEAALTLPKSTEYSVLTLPESKVIYSTFPFRNPLSYMVGPMKVYALAFPQSKLTT